LRTTLKPYHSPTPSHPSHTHPPTPLPNTYNPPCNASRERKTNAHATTTVKEWTTNGRPLRRIQVRSLTKPQPHHDPRSSIIGFRTVLPTVSWHGTTLILTMLDTNLFSRYATMAQAMGAVPRSDNHIEIAHIK
jgi:hypothetical protein